MNRLSTLSDSSITYAVTNCSASARPCQNNSSTANAAASAIQTPDQASASRKLTRWERRLRMPRSSTSIATTNRLKRIQNRSTGNVTAGGRYQVSGKPKPSAVNHRQEVQVFLRSETCHRTPAVLRWSQPILLPQTPLHCAEDQAVHHVAEDDNQNHHRHYLAHIAQIATHHQQLTQTEAEKNHFRLDQRPPGKRPPLLHPIHDERQARRQQHGPEEAETACSQVAPCHAIDLWHLLAAVFHRDGHRQKRAHQHDKQDGFFRQSKPENGQRDPADAWQGLQTHQQTADSFFQELVARDG